MNVKHSSNKNYWMSPPEIAQRSRVVLGGIDLDPASSEEANRIIGAKRIITEKEDALSASCSWIQGDDPMSIYLNPPGGLVNRKSQTKLFWQELLWYWSMGFVSHAIFLAFSIEALQTTQIKCVMSIMDFPFCVPSRRIAFIDPDDKSKRSPSHSNVIAYLPGTIDNTKGFISEFKFLGKVLTPYN